MEQVPYPKSFFDFFHHASTSLLDYLHHLLAPHPHAMSSPVDSMAPDGFGSRSKRRMVQLKTKEECRLSNAMLQVWTVELPSKHAEAILRSARVASLSYHPTH